MGKIIRIASVGLAAFVLLGCGGQRSDLPPKGSEAATSLEKGIPTKGAQQGSKQPAPPPAAE